MLNFWKHSFMSSPCNNIFFVEVQEIHFCLFYPSNVNYMCWINIYRFVIFDCYNAEEYTSSYHILLYFLDNKHTLICTICIILWLTLSYSYPCTDVTILHKNLTNALIYVNTTLFTLLYLDMFLILRVHPQGVLIYFMNRVSKVAL